MQNEKNVNKKTISKLTLNKESITKLEAPELILGGEDAGVGGTTDSGCTWILTTPAGTMISIWIDCTINH